ncbi:hypothetical protein [Leptotrichia sp. oral taxon 223]|uniref:hypothetical protein n=1 Tax=Leptotrichia sp. oral taxon 223 TaxID=712363 RepID=UPI0015B81978|nr:hypothetical protein [Leptotrichia sp. oral taxon 223]NWO19867.1 hypothetical protein [Leptotrichia sp. oral taxon 223]
MKKLIMLGLLTFTMLGIAEPYKDNRGVLFMNEDEWVKFYNKDGQDVAVCLVIGSMIMEESYIKDGKKMTHTLAEVQQGIKDFNKMLGETGLRDINGGTDKIHEFYYAAVCKKPSQKDFDLVGSPTFKKEMDRIFETHKIIED